MATITLTTAPAGGWTQIPEARAIYYNGKTYFGYVDGTSGNVEIRTYTHATGVTSAATVLRAAVSSPPDTHDAPAILIRDSDKKIVVAYSAHNGAQLYVRISSNAEDISSFAAEQTLDAVVGGTAYTYPTLIQRLAEASDPIYLFFRNSVGGTTIWGYTKSTDGGSTWDAMHQVYQNGATPTYMKVTSDGQGRIDFVVTDGNVPVSGTSKIYHFYADLTDYHKSDGTVIAASQPFAPGDLTEVYDSAAGIGWPTDLIYDGTNPRFVYSVDNGAGDSSFRYARWTGAAWVLSIIDSSVGVGIVDPSPVATLDAADTTRVYYCEKVAGKFEIRRGITDDNGASWTIDNITTGSSVDNIYPVVIRNHPSDLAIMWLAGTYTSITSNSLAILASDAGVGVPGFWLDFARDGFAASGTSASPYLVRMLPQGTSSVSDDITSDVISIQIDRVADVNGGTPIGSMTVVTKNTGGKYNPDNGSSSVYGQIDPGTPVWFGCNADLTLSGSGQTVYGRFAGYSRTVAPIPVAGATDAPTAEWVFDDAMARYRDAKARVAFSTTRTVATYRTAVLTAIGETRTNLATESDTLPATGSVGVGTTILSGARWRRYLTPTNVAPDSLATAREQVRKKPVVTALSVLEDLNKAVGSRHFIAPADTKEDWYDYTTRNRQYKLGAAADAALTAMVTATSGYVHSNDGIVNAMSVEARPFRIAPQKVVVWEYQAVPFAIDAGSSKTIVADFGDMVYDATLTVASTNSLTTAALTAYGDGAGIALSSTGPDTVTALYVEGRPVTRLDVVVVEKSDAASQAASGEMQGPNVSSDLITSEGLAEGIASYHIWASKSPRKTPSVTIINNPATLLPLDLHDVVTLTIPQLDVSSKRFEIVGIHETWTRAASASLRVVAFTLDLRQTPNSTALSLFTIGSSTLGGSDGLAP